MPFDIRQYITEANDALRPVQSATTKVIDSDGKVGKVVGVDKTHAHIRWKNGDTDKVAFYELEMSPKLKAWVWRI